MRKTIKTPQGLSYKLKEVKSPMSIVPSCWWKVNDTKNPTLSQLVWWFHYCPPGRDSERMFSTAKDMSVSKRLCLQSEVLMGKYTIA